MAIRTLLRGAVAGFALSAVCGAQSTPAQKPPAAPCPASSQAPNQTSSQVAAKPCTPPATNAPQPSAAQQFPFPGEASPPDNPPAAPSASHPSAASAHPYPGDSSGDSSSDAGSSSSSSSSSSDAGDNPSPPIGPPLHDEGSEGKSTRRKLPKVEKVQTDDERVDEDLRVAKFYLNDDNLPGAYLRAKDAVRVQPDYSETHFMLAEVAQKMKKKQEAVAEFQTYLKLDPQGERMKAAQKALAELK